MYQSELICSLRDGGGWAQDSVVRSLYDIMSKYWKPRSSRRNLGNEDGSGDEETGVNPGSDCVNDGYDEGEVCLAAALGCDIQAAVVEPVRDSQIPPDTFTEGAAADKPIEVVEVEESQGSDPAPEPAETLIDTPSTTLSPQWPSIAGSPAITPTELEETPPPPAPQTAEPPAHPNLIVQATPPVPVPSASKSETMDLKTVQEQIKQLQ